MRVLMFPKITSTVGEESGIKRVIEAYHRHGPSVGIDFVNCEIEDESGYDLCAINAGSSNRYPKNRPLAAITHGVYWTADYDASTWEYKTNASVIETVRRADVVSVPSPWVAEPFQRDMRINPWVIPHGIDADLWEHDRPNKGYVLWNKNRAADVCSPAPMGTLARERPEAEFIATFAPPDASGNVHTIGVVPHHEMKILIQEAGVYLSTTKETFGIGILEAMASGVPVLGFDHGGNSALVQHGQTGYLAKPGNYADLARGLDYCYRYRDVLAENSKLVARQYTWENSMNILREFFESGIKIWEKRQTALSLPESLYHVKN